jgi:putative ABC transport system permease protein
MLSLYRTLSLRYLRQRWTRAILIVASIALGVATLVATRSINTTMARAVRTSASPLAGGADLLVTKGDSLIDVRVADLLAGVRGVRSVRPLLFKNVELPDLKDEGDAGALLIGVDLPQTMQSNSWGIKLVLWNTALTAFWNNQPACVAGEELNRRLDRRFPDRSQPLRVLGDTSKPATPLLRVGTLTAEGPAAALAGNVLVTKLDIARRVLGLRPGLVSRLDLLLEPGFDRDKVRARVGEVLKNKHIQAGRAHQIAQAIAVQGFASSAAWSPGVPQIAVPLAVAAFDASALRIQAEVTTPEEQDSSSQEVMRGMEAGFLLCGLGALVVGMFLVYNALSVSVAERRHEIGILRSLGATRRQVRLLFVGEAAVLGLAGAVLGIPLGLGLAYLGLEPARDAVNEILQVVKANRVEWTVDTALIAAGAGLVTALLAALVPAFRASAEEPAGAVRRIPPNPTWSYRLVQIAASAVLMALGVGFTVFGREGFTVFGRQLSPRVGNYGGLVLVLLAALLATPLFAAVGARLVQPLARRFLGIEGRLAADNLVRAPARTGLVIAALAAGVALVLQTAGIIRSNRDAVLDWNDRYLTADVIVSAGNPLSAGGQNKSLPEDLARDLRRHFPREIRAALPVRIRKPDFRDTRVQLTLVDARLFFHVNHDRTPPPPDLDLYRQMADRPGTVLASENFGALFGVKPGDTVTVSGVPLRVLGMVTDYAWPHGNLIMDWKDYAKRFRERGERKVNVFYVYLKPGANPDRVRTAIFRRFGASKGLVALTHQGYQELAAAQVERIYAIAYGQQVVVGLVAALGVVTALLIAVLQRRREMGVLRAVGASRAQVIRSVLAEAALMGVIGTAIGVLVGIPFEWFTLDIIILRESGYLYPMLIPWAEAGLIAGAALVTATLAGLGPALHAVRQRIPEAIAHE